MRFTDCKYFLHRHRSCGDERGNSPLARSFDMSSRLRKSICTLQISTTSFIHNTTDVVEKNSDQELMKVLWIGEHRISTMPV